MLGLLLRLSRFLGHSQLSRLSSQALAAALRGAQGPLRHKIEQQHHLPIASASEAATVISLWCPAQDRGGHMNARGWLFSCVLGCL